MKIIFITFLNAFKLKELWSYLAWQEIRLRYRRSKLGPFWITLSMFIFIAALGVVYSQLFKVGINEYLPYLAISFVLWGFISSSIVDGPSIYIESSNYLKDIKINPIVFVIRSISKNSIIFFHNFIIILLVYLYFEINPSFYFILAFFGLLLVIVNLFFISALLGILGARYRDILPITQSLVQVAFFVTPITWMPKLVNPDSLIISLNPFSHFLEIIRSPLMGNYPNPESWLISILILIITSLLTFYIYNKKLKNLVFWI